MIKFELLVCACLLFAISSLADASVSILPKPKVLQLGKGGWIIPETSEICYSPGAHRSAKWLKKLTANITESHLQRMSNCKSGAWRIELVPNLRTLGDEGYKLKINNNGVSISSSSEAGLFYGLQTLRQLLPAQIELSKKLENVELPTLEMEDSPSFAWRGSMLDLARNFFGVDDIKNHLERMALFKLNRLHLHLTDDQGWRIEIKAYPELAKHGGQGSVAGGRSGFLTQRQYIDLQQYAADRHIVIIPEIDMPGHSYAALASIPDLNCPGFANLSPMRAKPPQLYDGVEVHWNSLCLEKATTKIYVQKVLQEISAITKGPWIHVGGDEVANPKYGSFMKFVESLVYRLGKTPMGWQEMVSSDFSPRATTIAQMWHQSDVEINSPKIMSGCNLFYLDQSNTPDENLPNDWCQKGGVSLEQTYSFTSQGIQNVIGVEAPVWTEYANQSAQLDDRIWPRLAAVAEVAWSEQSQRNIDDFHTRLAVFGERFDAMGIEFFKTPTVPWVRGPISKSPQSVFLKFDP